MSCVVYSDSFPALPARRGAIERDIPPQPLSRMSDDARMTTGDLLKVMVNREFISDADQFWWDAVAPTFCTLLDKAEYPLNQQIQYLAFYQEILAPALGPRPINNKPHFHSFCNDDGSNLELSLNFSKEGSTVRMCLEPIGASAGRSEDPFNQVAMCALAQEVSRIFDVSLSWFDYFRERFFVAKEVASSVYPKMAPNEHTSVTSIAFDLKDGTLLPKIYFFPTVRALQEATSEQILIRQALTHLDPSDAAMKKAFTKLEDFVANFFQLRFECLSFDLIEPTLSRIKIYVRTPCTSLIQVKQIYSLGGRLQGPDIDGAFSRLDCLWSILFAGTAADQALPPCSHRTGGMIFNFELRPGCQLPVPKIYIPVRHYCPNDLMIAESIAKMSTEPGWKERGATYTANFRAVFSSPDPSKTIGRHTYIGFCHSEREGSYMTAYYSTNIFSNGSECDDNGKLLGPATKIQTHRYD